jgi:tetratricopeptide (TPR) repeat protein
MVFEKYLADSLHDPLELFTTIGEESSRSAQIHLKIDEFTNELKTTGLTSKSSKKQIKAVYSSVHATFLKKYSEEAYFTDIFESGNYNCVTASALYAMIFEDLGINYVIKETPVHVYLIAEPEGNEILVETTMPNKGILVFDERFKKNYVDYLHNSKFISDSEYNSGSTDKLFNTHYSKDKAIDLFQLAALQYYNQGIFQFQEKKYSLSAISLEKASLLYPSPNILFSLNVARINVFAEHLSAKTYDGKLLAKFLNSNAGNQESQQIAIDYFKSGTEELALNHPKMSVFEGFYQEFVDHVNDSIDISEISNIYYLGSGYLDYVNMKYSASLITLQKAFELNPENLRTKNLIQDVGFKHLFKDFRHEFLIDSMNKYFTIFPFLTDIESMINQYGYYHLRSIYNAFSHDQPEKGEFYISKLADATTRYPEMMLDPDLVTFAFGIGTTYYVTENKYEVAEKCAKTGLYYAPESVELENRLATIRSSKSDLYAYMDSRPSSSFSVESPSKPLTTEDLTKYMTESFPGCWEAVALISNGEESSLPKDESFRIVVNSNHELTISHGNETELAKWSLRTKSKLLYFINAADRSEYEVFRIQELGNNLIILLPYIDGTTRSDHSIMLVRCD